jgi:xylulokinase/glycerol kinase
MLNSGSLEVTSGTGAYVIGISERPVLDEEMRFLCNVAALPGYYIVEAPVLTAGSLYRWCGDFCFSSTPERKDRLAQLDRAAMESQPGAGGLILFPYFGGRGTPDWNAEQKGAVYGFTLDTTYGDFARATLEGLVFEIAGNIDIVESETGYISKTILVSGGLSKMALYNQMLADTTRKEVLVSDDNEATVQGAWISAGLAIGLFKTAEQGIEQVLSGRGNLVFHQNAQSVCCFDRLKAKRIKIFDRLYK